MGEGFGDYFAGSFFAARKPPDCRDVVMAWDGARGEGKPPCVRTLISDLTYESFDHRAAADEHHPSLVKAKPGARSRETRERESSFSGAPLDGPGLLAQHRDLGHSARHYRERRS